MHRGLIKKPADRRTVIAAGVTAMLAFPAVAMAASTDGGASAPDGNWPGFFDWVKDAVALDELYERNHFHWDEWTNEEQKAREREIDAVAQQVWHAATDMADLMGRVVDNSPKRLALLATLAIWGADKSSRNSFNFMAVEDGKDDMTNSGGLIPVLLKAIGPFAAATLPEVPFGRRYASEGRANA
jgi:hypothetical protein